MYTIRSMGRCKVLIIIIKIVIPDQRVGLDDQLCGSSDRLGGVIDL